MLAAAATLQAAVAPRVAVVEADLAALDAALPQRRATLERLSDRPEVQTAEVDASLFNPAELDARVAQRRKEFDDARDADRPACGRGSTQLEHDNQLDANQLLPALIESLADLSGRLLELSLVQAGARLEAITFEPIDLTDDEALLIASAYRRDWQNARASLVDSWRLIYFNANALRSDLDIVFSGDIGNLGDNPFRIRDTTGRLRAGVQFDAPLTRLSERNTYRQSLIEYQQARRELLPVPRPRLAGAAERAAADAAQRNQLRAAASGRAGGHFAGRSHATAAVAAAAGRRGRRRRAPRRPATWCSRCPTCSTCRTTS